MSSEGGQGCTEGSSAPGSQTQKAEAAISCDLTDYMGGYYVKSAAAGSQCCCQS